MKLLSAHISNFKLLEDVEIRFSTSKDRPLTVIRAENGSGKTSLLYALTWALYGQEGLPAEAQGLGLISKGTPPGQAVDVQVTIEFEHTDSDGEVSTYRLIRSTTETAGPDHKVSRGTTRVKLYRMTAAGSEEKPVEFVEKFFPQRLQGIFFTDGDRVQSFITQAAGAARRQEKVHNAVRDLLGLDRLQRAEEDLDTVVGKLRREANTSAGPAILAASEKVEATKAKLAELEADQAQLAEQLLNMGEQKLKWEQELNALRGIGDLDKLNAEIKGLEADLARLEADRVSALREMRNHVKSEAFSWELIGPRLHAGLQVLSTLANANVIPGVSVSVLEDRLALGSCICGESLDPADSQGASRRGHVESLIDQNRQRAESSQRMTATYHVARDRQTANQAREQAGETYGANCKSALQHYLATGDDIKAKTLAYENAKERRSKIDDERVRTLTERIRGVEAQLSSHDRKHAVLSDQIDREKAELMDANKVLEEANKAQKSTDQASVRWQIAHDLHELAHNTLVTLKQDYVARVGEKMQEIFLRIVGSDAEFEAAVFTGVRIANNFDIVVETKHGQRLDPSFELNGASQRALTLSFIWALMDVSGTTAPRIIDTPLGMVAGGVKTRMVEAITAPAGGEQPDFQVVLLLTRSEIRDIEELLDLRAGVSTTMSCSKDYPADLKYDWGVDHPLVRACGCDHRQSCRTCARHYDDKHDVIFREAAGVS